MAAPGSAAQTASCSRWAYHLRAPRAQRKPHGDLALAAAGLRQQKVCPSTSAQAISKNQRDGAEQNPEGFAHAAHGFLLQRLYQYGPFGESVGRKLQRQAALHSGEIGLCGGSA